MGFKEVTGRYHGPALEEQVLAFWQERNVFEQALKEADGRPLFIWNEGPPTANGKPGIHHVLARTFKDMFPRYKSMQGYHCPRKAGWDTHGLPVEHEVEKELGIFDKAQIVEQVGIAEFTRRCRESVMRYIGDWEKMTERMGFWVNMEDAYYTLDNNYIESVWWLLKQLWDKELIYKGYKVVPYDPRIGATLSSHEVALGYKEVEDPSIFVRFPLEGFPGTSFLVWTTTPWTLPSNLALAVHPDVDYAYVETQGETLIMAEELIEAVLRGAEYRVVKVVKGGSLVDLKYERLFCYLPATGDICRVRSAEFVTTEDGTGVVHCAPAYGEDDIKLCQAHGLPVIHGVGLDGHFVDEVELVAGLFFKEADPIIVENLTERGLMYRYEKYLHNYPHGWRTGDPLIYFAKDAWYIRTSQFRARMVELNNTINWVPTTIREGRFGNWLSNNVDWALSRERFWGTPLPVWTDDEGDFICIGSIDELEKLSGRCLNDLDLHRPAIDDIVFEHPVSGRQYHRVPDVIDCWFDSGAMSYAQFHYPFENKELFEQSFPADYICEAIDQTRGWFYSLHAIATLVSDSVAYKNCICLAHIVDKDAKKMSKSVGNIVDPYDVFDSVGADPLRWYMAARIAPEAQKRISVEFVREVASSFINTYWNTYAFFVMYAVLDKVDLNRGVPVSARPEIDRWILALLQKTIQIATEAMDNYNARRAGEAIESFVDQLSNWYVRRNRRRFWKAAEGDDKQAAYLTLYESLESVNRLIAPFMPFLSESVYQNLVRSLDDTAALSVHMAKWPAVVQANCDQSLLDDFKVVQQVVGLGRTARNDTGQRVRQPLPRLLVKVPTENEMESVTRHQAQILEELNVKTLEAVNEDVELVSFRIKPNLPRLGKRYGKLIPTIRDALANADGAMIAATVATGDTFDLVLDSQTLSLEAEDLLIETTSAQGYACAQEGGYLVGLDIHLTEDLRIEGLARELIRTVQDGRKQAGLDVSDRIRLRITGSAQVQAALAAHRTLVMGETLAVESEGDCFEGCYSVQHELDGACWMIELIRVA